MDIGVGIFEFEFTEEFRSWVKMCVVCTGDVSGGGQFPILNDDTIKLGWCVLMFKCGVCDCWALC
jgi:hypothetical protein